MKRSLLKKISVFSIVICSIITKAQPWSENFNSLVTPNIPANWFQNNVDNLPVFGPYESVFFFNGNAWVTNDSLPIDPTHGNYAVSASWYQPAGTSNDWLITHAFTVPANARLKWDAWGSVVGDSYFVAISTSGTLTSNFTTTLLSIPAEVNYWKTHNIDLSAYAGQTVHIAFVNNSTAKLIIKLDNISVYQTPANDGSVKDVTGLVRYNFGNQTVAGYFKSFGVNAANNAVLNYNVNNGTTVSQTMNFSAGLNYGDSVYYSFTIPATFTSGINHVKVWPTQVNGVNETINWNDSATFIVYNATQSVERNALIEEFESSTCSGSHGLSLSFCPLVNSLNPNTGGNVNVIKYHTIFGDPSFNNQAYKRADYYNINLLPEVYSNGTKLLINYDQTEINAAINFPAFADIKPTLTVFGNNITASASITPYLTIPVNSPLRIFNVLVQKYYQFPGSTTGQQDFYHAMRKMYPDTNGFALAPVSGNSLSVNFTYPIVILPVAPNQQNSYNFWQTTNIEYEYVVFIQDALTRDVIQSASASVLDPASVGVVEFKTEDQKIAVYPNPASDLATIGIRLNTNSDIELSIYDATGKLVYNNLSKNETPGQKEIKLDVSKFAAGIYNVNVETNAGTYKEKLIIGK